MPSPNDMTFAFTIKANGLLRSIHSDATIFVGDKSVKVDAVWDTGATGTTISHEVVEALELVATGKQTIRTPSGTTDVSTYLVSVGLPNNVNISDVSVCDSEIGNHGIGMLIGMDIICMGDLSISNVGKKTVFSFRIPSRKMIDFVVQANIDNAIGLKHGSGKKKKHK